MLRAAADVRQVFCYLISLSLSALLIHWYSRPGDNVIATVFSVAMIVILGGELLVHCSICVEVWLQNDLPRHVRSIVRRLG